MQEKLKYDIFSLNVRGIRDQSKCIFSYLKDQKAKFLFSTRNILGTERWNNLEWGGDMFFSPWNHHSRGVYILLHPTMTFQMEYLFRNNTGRIMLITILLNSMNIYAPNNQTDQLEFLQELNNCIMDKSELSSLIVGGDWNCALKNKDKMGGTTWKPTVYGNLILATVDAFDLVDIQRFRHPRLKKYAYESKALKARSRIDFFSMAKNPTRYVKKSEIHPSIASDHFAIYLLLSWTSENSRGQGLWKYKRYSL